MTWRRFRLRRRYGATGRFGAVSGMRVGCGGVEDENENEDEDDDDYEGECRVG